jgi:single-stranded-DNA-specific exonuclease
LTKRWKIKEKADQTIVQKLSAELGIDGTLANILVQRGINSFTEAKDFFRPSLTHLHDPFLMKDMDKAIARIETALKKNEGILIYGDYDVDGTTAVALVFTFLKSIHKNIDYYIPDRYAEGYGISFTGIDWARDNGYSLIIALDCGIKSVDKVEYATKHNIDFIICDHHRPGNEIPQAIAVLDPKRNDCNYPFKELSGCGLGLKLVQAYLVKNKLPFEDLEPYLDLAVVSIAADIVPVVDENRILAYYGLKRFNTNPRPGFKAMLELANVKRELTVSDLVFIIGPRINAAGRIENGKKAVELLISDNSASALLSGQNINITNTQRRDLDVKITEHALSMIDNNETLIDRKSTVLFHNEWHKGVIGIVASRLTEKYYRPTIVLTESNGMATGSARSVKDFDVYEAIEACSELLEQFGGHKYAAGLTMKLENVEAFQKKFESIVASTIADYMLIPEIEIDDTIQFGDINQKFLRILKQLAPFGPENMSPVFLTNNVIDSGKICIVGSNHLKMNLQDAKDPKETFAAIAFGAGHLFNDIYQRKPFNICYTIEENEWNGNTSVQLNIKDIKFDFIPSR